MIINVKHTLHRLWKVEQKGIFGKPGRSSSNAIYGGLGRASAAGAIVSLAGVTFKDASNCKSTRPVSLLQIHAVDDDIILFEGNKGYPGLGDYPGARATVDLWVGRNRCVETLEDTEEFNLTNSIPGVDTKVSRWSQCQQKTDVELWTIRPYKSRWHTAHVPRLADSFAPRVLDFLLSHSLNVGPAKRP